VQVALGAVALNLSGTQGSRSEPWCVPCPTSSAIRRLVNVLNGVLGLLTGLLGGLTGGLGGVVP